MSPLLAALESLRQRFSKHASVHGAYTSIRFRLVEGQWVFSEGLPSQCFDIFRRLAIQGGRLLMEYPRFANLISAKSMHYNSPDDVFFQTLIDFRAELIYWREEGGSPAFKVPATKITTRTEGRLHRAAAHSVALIDRLLLIAEAEGNSELLAPIHETLDRTVETPIIVPQLGPAEWRILAALKKLGATHPDNLKSLKEFAKSECDTSPESLKNPASNLKKLKLIDSQGSGRGSGYWLTQAGLDRLDRKGSEKVAKR